VSSPYQNGILETRVQTTRWLGKDKLGNMSGSSLLICYIIHSLDFFICKVYKGNLAVPLCKVLASSHHLRLAKRQNQHVEKYACKTMVVMKTSDFVNICYVRLNCREVRFRKN